MAGLWPAPAMAATRYGVGTMVLAAMLARAEGTSALRLPRDTPPAERARVQMLGAAVVALSQGVAYFHAGMELLRSKSLDRNSFDSGDWFNRIDWTATDNHFGTGLPPAPENGRDYALLRPLLARRRTG